MSEHYTRAEVCKLFHPPVSRHYLRCMEDAGRMPLSIKTPKERIYKKTEIDEWLSLGVQKNKCGRKAKVRQHRMNSEDFDVWNIRKDREKIRYDGDMVLMLNFLQPGLRHRQECRA